MIDENNFHNSVDNLKLSVVNNETGQIVTAEWVLEGLRFQINASSYLEAIRKAAWLTNERTEAYEALTQKVKDFRIK